MEQGEIVERRPLEKRFTESYITPSSKNWLLFPEAVRYVNSLDAVLLSLREAILNGVEITKSKEDHYEVLRTIVAYMLDTSGNFLAAFDDSMYFEENIGLGRAWEGFRSHFKTGRFLLPKKEYAVKQLLDRADKAHRIVQVESKLELATKRIESCSEFEMSSVSRALCGDITALCGATLHRRNYAEVSIYQALPEMLSSILDRDHVEIRAVGIKANYYQDKFEIVANYPFYFSGFARGIKNK